MNRYIMMAALVPAGLLAGCGSVLPVYPTMSDADALATIADRHALVMSISAECDLDLTDAQGQRVSLEGVLVAEPPGRVRLRAWKFGHAVFDLTVADGQAWIMVPDDGAGVHRFDVENIPARQVSEALDLLGAAYFRTAKPLGGDTSVLRAQGAGLGRSDVVCEIDRSTLTPRRFGVGSDGSSVELLLDEYTLVGEVVWPMRMRLRSGSREVVVRIRELELNGEVPPAAFSPPKRAKALP